MTLNPKLFAMALATTVLMSGCAANRSQLAPSEARTANVSKQVPPEILGVTKVDGRGIPWGRSDSNAAFTPLTQMAASPSYGFTQAHPIRVGGFTETREAGYLNGLRGPAGEPIDYERIGSCCPFKTDKGLVDGVGLLDAFRVTYQGQAQAAILYIDFYDEEPLYVPLGFTPRQSGASAPLPSASQRQ